MNSETEAALDRVKQHEGFRAMPYADSVGVETIGYGCALSVGWSEPFAEAVAKLQVEAAEQECMAIPGYLEADPLRRSVLIEMMFNLGRNRLYGFHNFLRAIKDGDYKQAAAEMLDSKWAVQVKQRAVRLATIMEKGTDA